jgi:hypothetical protein
VIRNLDTETKLIRDRLVAQGYVSRIIALPSHRTIKTRVTASTVQQAIEQIAQDLDGMDITGNFYLVIAPKPNPNGGTYGTDGERNTSDEDEWHH